MRRVIFVKHDDPETAVRMLNSIISGRGYEIEVGSGTEVRQEASEQSQQSSDKPGLWARIVTWFKG